MGVTIRDVAEAAGVSTATVSRALRGLPYVDEVTRGRVIAAARALDYVVSPSASRLASGRTGTIAVVTPHLARSFFASVLAGVEEVTREAALDLLVIVVDEHAADDAGVEQRLRQRADGAIVVALPPDNPQVRHLMGTSLPMSFVGSIVPGAPSIAIDDVETARIATRHLINLGHRGIGLITGSPGPGMAAVQQNRERGYREALEAAGIAFDPHVLTHGDFTQDGGERAMVQLLSGAAVPSAVFCLSDVMAFGALIALRRHGLVPGDDVSVIGVDGHPQCDVVDLTTVEQPVVEMGRFAASALVATLQTAGQENVPVPRVVDTRLVVRGSTAPPRALR